MNKEKETIKNMKAKHTPGPWNIRFLREKDIESGFFVEAKNNNMPELGYGIEIMGDDYGVHNGYPAEQRYADAKLIAASLDMLEALKEAKAYFLRAGMRLGGRTYTIIDEAIKKATE